MNFACTLATIAQLVGHPLKPGDRVDVPRWRYEQASRSERYHAITCARQLGIRWRIVEG